LLRLARHKRAGVKSPANRKPLDFSYRVNAKPRKSRADWPTKISVWSVEPTQLSVLDLDRANPMNFGTGKSNFDSRFFAFHFYRESDAEEILKLDPN